MSSRGARYLVSVVAAAGTLVCAGGALADRGGVPNGGREDRPQPQGPPAAQQEPQEKATPPGQEQRPDAAPAPPGQERRTAPRPRSTETTGPPSGASPRAVQSQGEGRGQDKTTICHATGSDTNPYVEITIANPALPAHGRHGDLIPAPAGGCPATQQPAGTLTEDATPPAASPRNTQDPPPGTNGQADVPVSGVLGATAEAPAQGALPASAGTGDPAGSGGNSLPFTGLQLLLLVALGVTALAGGYALRHGGAVRPA